LLALTHPDLVSEEARVRLADSRLEELALDGPYEVEGASGAEVSGTFSLRRRVTSAPASRSDR
jgi:hypothetical protein